MLASVVGKQNGSKPFASEDAFMYLLAMGKLLCACVKFILVLSLNICFCRKSNLLTIVVSDACPGKVVIRMRKICPSIVNKNTQTKRWMQCHRTINDIITLDNEILRIMFLHDYTYFEISLTYMSLILNLKKITECM